MTYPKYKLGEEMVREIAVPATNKMFQPDRKVVWENRLHFFKQQWEENISDTIFFSWISCSDIFIKTYRKGSCIFPSKHAKYPTIANSTQISEGYKIMCECSTVNGWAGCFKEHPIQSMAIFLACNKVGNPFVCILKH